MFKINLTRVKSDSGKEILVLTFEIGYKLTWRISCLQLRDIELILTFEIDFQKNMILILISNMVLNFLGMLHLAYQHELVSWDGKIYQFNVSFTPSLNVCGIELVIFISLSLLNLFFHFWFIYWCVSASRESWILVVAKGKVTAFSPPNSSSSVPYLSFIFLLSPDVFLSSALYFLNHVFLGAFSANIFHRASHFWGSTYKIPTILICINNT